MLDHVAQALLPVPVFVVSPLRGSDYSPDLPRAYALGYLISPLRSWISPGDHHWFQPQWHCCDQVKHTAEGVAPHWKQSPLPQRTQRNTEASMNNPFAYFASFAVRAFELIAMCQLPMAAFTPLCCWRAWRFLPARQTPKDHSPRCQPGSFGPAQLR